MIKMWYYCLKDIETSWKPHPLGNCCKPLNLARSWFRFTNFDYISLIISFEYEIDHWICLHRVWFQQSNNTYLRNEDWKTNLHILFKVSRLTGKFAFYLLLHFTFFWYVIIYDLSVNSGSSFEIFKFAGGKREQKVSRHLCFKRFLATKSS
jgi:hypothetical protein